MSISKRTVKGKKQYRYVISYKEGDKYKQIASKWFSSSAEAKKAEALYRKEHPVITSKTRLSVDSVFEEMMKDKEHRISKGTIRVYRNHYKNHVQPVIGKKEIEKLRTQDLKKVMDEVKYLKGDTQKVDYALLRMIFEYAEKYYDISPTAFKKLEFKPVKYESTARALTPEEFSEFLNALPEKRWMFKNLFYVLYWTGLRISEALSLTFDHVTDKGLNINRQFNTKDKEWGSTKTKQSRIVAIDSETRKKIDELHDYYKNTYPEEFSETWFVFGGYKFLYPDHVRYVKNYTIKKHGLLYFRLHDLRHSHASYLIEQGVSLYKVSKRLGHSNISITADRYGHIIDEDSKEILSVIEPMSEKCQNRNEDSDISDVSSDSKPDESGTKSTRHEDTKTNNIH